MSHSNSVVFPLLYAGPVSYYAQWLNQKGVLDAHENFQKQSFRSRCKVYGANGVISLSIPIDSHSKKAKMKDAQISNIEGWQRIHWRTIESAYKSSPFFEFYSHLWHPLFTKPYTSLWEFNMDVHQVVLECLQLKTDPKISSVSESLQENDLRISYTSKKNHPLASNFPTYQQVFSYTNHFESDLSIMDAVFNLGPETESYLDKIYSHFFLTQ
jgi:hypothetical protein